MLEKLLNKTNNYMLYASGVVTLIIIILCFFQVIARYVLHVSAPWTEELSKSGFLWCVLVCCGLCVIDGSNPVMSMLQDWLANKNHHNGIFIQGVFSHIIMFITMTVVVFSTVSILDKVSIAVTPILRINFIFLYLSFIVGGVIVMLSIILKMILLYKEWKGGHDITTKGANES